MIEGGAIVEILLRIEPAPGQTARLVGRLPEGEFALVQPAPTGIGRQLGPKVGFAEACGLAAAVLDGDRAALGARDTAHRLALALLGAAWSGASREKRPTLRHEGAKL